MDLPKAFDTSNLDFLIAKQHPYDFDRDSLKIFHYYFK